MPQVKRKSGAYTTADKLQLVKGGAEYFSLLKKLIDEATSVIHLQVYIFNENETGLTIAESLIEAGHRGVKVYLIVDGYASEHFSQELIERFKTAGICYRRFAPLLKSSYFYFGRRLHHKVFVADNRRALVGGINISNRYNDMPGRPAWMDRALYVEGAIGGHLARVCCDVWNKTYDRNSREKLIPEGRITENQADKGNYAVRVRINDWVRRRDEVSYSYLGMFKNAQQCIYIVCSYFMPGVIYRRQMAKAVKRGVKVKVVLGGISDVALSKYAERYLYRWMLKNGIEIYEYQKNVLHAKMAVYDSKWMTIGSYNVNDISALASIELNIDVDNTSFAENVQAGIEQLIAEDCKQITYENYKVTTGWWKQKAQLVAYQLVKIMLFAVTFYYKRQRD